MRRLDRPALLGIVYLVLAATAAQAHHPMGGATPATFLDGFLSGLGHPILGLDHLAFLCAVAVLTAATRRAWLPLAFIPALLMGVLLHVAGVTVPVLEPAVSATVFLAGVTLLLALGRFPVALVAFLGVAGILHGLALGETVVGAEPTPVLAYLAGLAVVQMAVVAALTLAVRAAMGRFDSGTALVSRVAGGALVIVGAVVTGASLLA